MFEFLTPIISYPRLRLHIKMSELLLSPKHAALSKLSSSPGLRQQNTFDTNIQIAQFTLSWREEKSELYISMCTHIYMYTCVCIYIHVRACTHVCARKLLNYFVLQDSFWKLSQSRYLSPLFWYLQRGRQIGLVFVSQKIIWEYKGCALSHSNFLEGFHKNQHFYEIC